MWLTEFILWPKFWGKEVRLRLHWFTFRDKELPNRAVFPPGRFALRTLSHMLVVS
jgi:hypothetical protein